MSTLKADVVLPEVICSNQARLPPPGIAPIVGGSLPGTASLMFCCPSCGSDTETSRTETLSLSTGGVREGSQGLQQSVCKVLSIPGHGPVGTMPFGYMVCHWLQSLRGAGSHSDGDDGGCQGRDFWSINIIVVLCLCLCVCRLALSCFGPCFVPFCCGILQCSRLSPCHVMHLLSCFSVVFRDVSGQPAFRRRFMALNIDFRISFQSHV